LLEAVLVVPAVRLALWVLPFHLLRQLLQRIERSSRPSCSAAADVTWQVSWSVVTVSRRVPAATCLTQALASQILLWRRGQPSRLHIGVAKDGDRRLIAHAWLESGGQIVVGSRGHDRYTPLRPCPDRLDTY
jgi:hypothetical protein